MTLVLFILRDITSRLSWPWSAARSGQISCLCALKRLYLLSGKLSVKKCLRVESLLAPVGLLQLYVLATGACFCHNI